MASCGTGSIAKRWRELQGEKSWEGLLEPLDMDLRKSILSYGELVAAAGDGFNNEPHSLNIGKCRYSPDHLLTKSGVAAAGHYKVTKFVHAWEDMKATMIGYVAVATDEGVAALGRRDILVAWRGSVTGAEWWKDLQACLTSPWAALGLAESPIAHGHPCARVHSGFLSLYTAAIGSGSGIAAIDIFEITDSSARGQVLAEVRRLVELYRNEEHSITVVGHSLGAALSILNAIDLVGNGVNRVGCRPPCPVTAIVFACPHVGDGSFRDAFGSIRDLKVLHVRNHRDVVPCLPDCLPDLGVTLYIDTARSHYLKDNILQNMVIAHNLDCYLHCVAGEVGGDGEFRLVVDRDVALVNRYADALKDDYHVPANWWVPENKGMVKNDQGKWELKDLEEY